MEAHRCILLLSFFIAMAVVGGVEGGLTDDRGGDEHSQGVANAIRPKVVAKLGASSIRQFRVIKHRTRIGVGTFYYLKIQIAPHKYIHVEVYQGLDEDYHLRGLDQNKSAADPVEFYIKRLEQN